LLLRVGLCVRRLLRASAGGRRHQPRHVPDKAHRALRREVPGQPAGEKADGVGELQDAHVRERRHGFDMAARDRHALVLQEQIDRGTRGVPLRTSGGFLSELARAACKLFRDEPADEQSVG
jgi:hypothetical protein